MKIRSKEVVELVVEKVEETKQMRTKVSIRMKIAVKIMNTIVEVMNTIVIPQ